MAAACTTADSNGRARPGRQVNSRVVGPLFNARTSQPLSEKAIPGTGAVGNSTPGTMVIEPDDVASTATSVGAASDGYRASGAARCNVKATRLTVRADDPARGRHSTGRQTERPWRSGRREWLEDQQCSECRAPPGTGR